MIPVFKEPIIFYDVDDTLVSWNFYGTYKEGMVEFNFPVINESVWLETIDENIKSLKNHKLRGHTIVVWSASGADWAKEVVNKLNLQTYVDVIMSKPTLFYDDVPSSEFMPEALRKHCSMKKCNNE